LHLERCQMLLSMLAWNELLWCHTSQGLDRRQLWPHSDSTVSFQLQDEISTGLDSSTTFLITKCIRNFVHMQDVRASEPGCPML
jgi:hypothetical protein